MKKVIFFLEYTACDPWKAFDKGKRVSFQVLSNPASFALEGKDEDEVSIICAAVTEIIEKGSSLKLKASATIQNEGLVVNEHGEFSKDLLGVPNSIRIMALSYLDEFNSKGLDLSKNCNVVQIMGKENFYRVTFKIQNDYLITGTVTSDGEFVPEENYPKDVLDWMTSHLDSSLITQVGIKQMSYPLF